MGTASRRDGSGGDSRGDARSRVELLRAFLALSERTGWDPTRRTKAEQATCMALLSAHTYWERGVVPDGRLLDVALVLYHIPTFTPVVGAMAEGLPGPPTPIGGVDEDETVVVTGALDDTLLRGLAGEMHGVLAGEMGFSLYSWQLIDPVATAISHQTQETVFVAVRGTRVVGFARTQIHDGLVLSCVTTEAGFVKPSCSLGFTQGPRPLLDLVWVAPDYRGSGVAALLVRTAAAVHGLDSPSGLLFGLPFTEGGLGLVRSLVGPEFVVSGEWSCEASFYSHLPRPDRVTPLGYGSLAYRRAVSVPV